MMKNKSTLAKLLAEEDVFVVHKQMETAYFDSKKRELGLPIWKDEEMTNDIYDLMVCHEIGHALWTPLDMLEKAATRKINHSFVNILEDARIEKMVKGKYPGAIGVFNRGYVDLLKKDFFGTEKKGIENFNLIDRINVFFKSADSTISFTEEEKVWVEKTANTKTPDDVLDLAEELYAWMKEKESDTDNHNSGEESEMGMADPNGKPMESGNSDGENKGDDDNSGNKSDAGNSDDNDDAEDGEGSRSGKGEEVDEDSDETNSGVGGTDTDDSSTDDTDTNDADADVDTAEGGKNSSGGASAPKASTDSAFGKAMDELRDKAAEDRTYARIPKVDLKDILVGHGKLLAEFVPYYEEARKSESASYFDSCLADLETLKNDSKKTVAYMVKEFEMKKTADAYARAATSKTGSLDMSKLHTYKYNEDLFKKVTTLPGATNHGLIMVLDWSGSMCDNLKGTLSQLYNLIWFCRRTKIPFEVFAFSDHYNRDGKIRSEMEPVNKFKAGDLALNKFHLLNFFTSNMTTAEEMSMMHVLWMYALRHVGYRDWSIHGYPYTPPKNLQLGGTPLNDAIVAMMEIVPKFKADTGVQKVNTVFLTDGCSNRMQGVFEYKYNTETEEHRETLDSGAFGGWHTWQRDNKVIITDPVINKTYEVPNSNSVTNTLIKILKNRVYDMNVIGFFIAGSGRSGRIDKRTLYYLLPESDRSKVMDLIKFANKNKYIAITQLGYDEYYVLPGGNALAVENEGLSDELVGASKAKLKSAFGKSMKGRIESRQLLNKFVKLVA